MTDGKRKKGTTMDTVSSKSKSKWGQKRAFRGGRGGISQQSAEAGRGRQRGKGSIGT